MARQLNKTRIRDTKLVLLIFFLLIVFSRPEDSEDSVLHETLDMLGSLFIGACALGRVYCTAFLGGHKNAALITYGPFSVTRNPLYFCSFLGACGIALISNYFIMIVALPIIYCLVYFALITREEAYLTEYFGDEYVKYCKKTPRFFPNFSKHRAPDTVPMYPKYLFKALKDGLMWFTVLPLFELIEKLQELGYIHGFFTLP